MPSATPAPPVDPGFWRDRRVLLTGHTGFKGAWLALWLARMGARVTGFSLAPPTDPSLFAAAGVGADVESLHGDLRDPAAVDAAVVAARPEVVLHLAAQALVRRGLEAPAETYAINVLGTAHLLESVARLGSDTAAVVVVTSDKCYENREWVWGYREDEPLGGRDPYSSSKAGQELVTHALRASLLAGRGVGVATARAGNVIGGGDWAPDRLVPDLIRAAQAGRPLAVRNPAAIRPWQHVLNPLEGYLALAEALAGPRREAVSEGWNFGPSAEDARPVRWIVERLGGDWPGGLQVDYADPADATEAQALRLDSAKARAGLGWQPRWDLERALDTTLEWYAGVAAGEDARALTQRQLAAFLEPARPATLGR